MGLSFSRISQYVDGLVDDGLVYEVGGRHCTLTATAKGCAHAPRLDPPAQGPTGQRGNRPRLDPPSLAVQALIDLEDGVWPDSANVRRRMRDVGFIRSTARGRKRRDLYVTIKGLETLKRAAELGHMSQRRRLAYDDARLRQRARELFERFKSGGDAESMRLQIIDCDRELRRSLLDADALWIRWSFMIEELNIAPQLS